jgi:hypothetical protein
MFFIAILFLQIRRYGAMKFYSAVIVMLSVAVMLSTFCMLSVPDEGDVEAQVISDNSPPVLTDPGMYIWENDATFSVTYWDTDGDEGGVTLIFDGNPHEMVTYDNDATTGLYYEIILQSSTVEDPMEFHFTAHDDNGSEIELFDDFGNPFVVGDFDGWGEPPVLSAPDVYFDNDDKEWVFNVTFQDPDGDEAYAVTLYLDDEWWGTMETQDTDPLTGQDYIAFVHEADANQYTEFYFEADDVQGSYTDLYDTNYNPFLVGPFIESDGNGGGNGGGDDGDGGGISFGFPAGWDDPEVIVGLVALVGMAGAGGYGLYRKKKKRSRFSDLLTQLDDIYNSFKTNPHKCEIELEKVRGTINEDLKSSVIDENNYNILKDRIEEIMQEIRSDSLLAEVRDMPKDIEIKIKDMLIDGKITRAEYDKMLPIIKGSEMTSGDKEKMEKKLESWVEKDRKAGK